MFPLAWATQYTNLEAKCIEYVVYIELKREYVYESLCNCTVIEDHYNTEKAISIG